MCLESKKKAVWIPGVDSNHDQQSQSYLRGLSTQSNTPESPCTRPRSEGAPVARFALCEVRANLECGVLAYGFLRAYCNACGHDRIVAFAC
jgi:hypothetical protein